MANVYLMFGGAGGGGGSGGGTGGVDLEPLANPAQASDILLGKEAYDSSGERIVGALLITDVHPTLNAVSIAKSNNNLNITNPSTNGNFVKGYKILSGGNVVTSITSSPLDMTTLENAQYVFTCRAIGTGFNDSPDSNALTITVYAFLNGLQHLTADNSFSKTTSGMTLNFTIVADEGYYLPPEIDIRCNGEQLDFSYNPYTGDVQISALRTAYSAEVVDGGTLAAPTIELTKNAFEMTPVAFAESVGIYDEDGTLYAVAAIPNASDVINIGAEGLQTPQLLAPLITLNVNSIICVDSYLLVGDVFYSQSYELYVDDVSYADNLDADDQFMLFSYSGNDNGQFVKQSAANTYKTATSSSYANTYAYIRAKILAPKASRLKISYILYPYNSYVRCYIGKLDVALTKSVSTAPSSTQYLVASSGTSTITNSVTIDIPAGAHFVDFLKQYNTTSTSSTYYNRYMQFTLEEVE